MADMRSEFESWMRAKGFPDDNTPYPKDVWRAWAAARQTAACPTLVPVAYRECHQGGAGDSFDMEFKLWELAPGQDVPEGAEPLFAYRTPGPNLGQFRTLVEVLVEHAESKLTDEQFMLAGRLLNLIDGKA